MDYYLLPICDISPSVCIFVSEKVESAIKHARRGLPLEAKEAMALLSLLLFSEALQLNLKAAIKEDSDWYKQFMPLSEMVNSSLQILSLSCSFTCICIFRFYFFFCFKKKYACR